MIHPVTLEPVLLSQITAIAQSVRTWTEQKATRAKYNPGDLCGWCGISAAQLFRALSRCGIKALLHYTPGHCFVEVNNHVVDVTATQFRDFADKKILVLHMSEAEKYWHYQSTHQFKYPTELRDHQLKEKWPAEEIAYTR
jgi:hypothetical protein